MISGNDYPWVKDNPQDLGDVASWDGSLHYVLSLWEDTLNNIETLKRKYCYFEEIFVTGCTGSCQFDNFWCSWWRKFPQKCIFVSVKKPKVCRRPGLFGIRFDLLNGYDISCYIMWSFMVVISLNWAGPLCKGLQITSRHDTNLFVIGGTGGCR